VGVEPNLKDVVDEAALVVPGVVDDAAPKENVVLVLGFAFAFAFALALVKLFVLLLPKEKAEGADVVAAGVEEEDGVNEKEVAFGFV